MTRLKSEWIKDLDKTASEWNLSLKEIAGVGYIELAAYISGNSVEKILQAAEEYKVAVIPITSGDGIINTFSESVAAIVSSMGFDAFVTEKTDVDGIHEAYMNDADIMFMADDTRYIAISARNGMACDNNIATAYGFSEILCRMAGEIKNKNVAVLGYGIIGELMAEYLADKGATIYIYEKKHELRQKAENSGYFWIEDAEKLKSCDYIADATCTGNWLSKNMLSENAVIAAPGIPFSLDSESADEMKGRYVHDLLEIGTAVMVGMAV